jgi:hypothetical protein
LLPAESDLLAGKHDGASKLAFALLTQSPLTISTSTNCAASLSNTSGATASCTKPWPPAPTPLHLTLVFNIDHTNAMAYASAARNLLGEL